MVQNSYDPEVQYFKDAHKSKNKRMVGLSLNLDFKKMLMDKKTSLDEYVDEGTLEQGFVTNGAGWLKDRRLNQISEDELGTDNDDVPVGSTTMPTKGKKPAMTPRQKGRRDTALAQSPVSTSGVSIHNYGSRNVISEDELGTDNDDVPAMRSTKGKKQKGSGRRETAPAQLPMPTSGVSIHNYGSGNVVNRNVGDIENSTISNVGNDNSENHYFQPRPTYATKEPAMTPGQNLRRDTAPAQLPGLTPRVSIHNYGSGNVGNSDVGNIKNSFITDVGNNNSKNYYQARPKATYDRY